MVRKAYQMINIKFIYMKNKPEKLFEKFKTPNIIETKWGDICTLIKH